jgi:hypothetical protein
MAKIVVIAVKSSGIENKWQWLIWRRRIGRRWKGGGGVMRNGIA